MKKKYDLFNLYVCTVINDENDNTKFICECKNDLIGNQYFKEIFSGYKFRYRDLMIENYYMYYLKKNSFDNSTIQIPYYISKNEILKNYIEINDNINLKNKIKEFKRK